MKEEGGKSRPQNNELDEEGPKDNTQWSQFRFQIIGFGIYNPNVLQKHSEEDNDRFEAQPNPTRVFHPASFENEESDRVANQWQQREDCQEVVQRASDADITRGPAFSHRFRVYPRTGS